MSRSGAPRTSVRWWTVAGLIGFSFTSYLVRSNISVAAALMMPALGISKVKMGQIFTSFLIGYALFQIPGGFLGDRFGPRRTLAVSAVVWGAATLLSGLVPVLFAGRLLAVFTVLWLVRFGLGVSEAVTFPVGNRVVHDWMPLKERALGMSIMVLGTCAASAAAGPLVSWLMLRYGWIPSFYLTSIPAFLIAVLWYWLARDEPASHPRVNDAEKAYIAEGRESHLTRAASSVPAGRWLLRRNVVLLVLSYLSEGYVLFIFVFWLYIYLVEKRGFSMMRGGWLASLPWLTALLLTPLGGLLSDWLGAKYGRLRGARVVIMISYGSSGLLLFFAAYARSTWESVACLCFSIAFLMGAESSFWASATYLGESHVGTLSGVMNTAGVLGGILSTSLTPVLVEHFGWLTAFASGTVMALISVLLWAAVREPRKMVA